MNRPLTLNLSIVIPVYNEENYLKDCLDSIADQSVEPLEVIIVDNNSTDRSMEIARSYPFVRILSETRQGQMFAQGIGFDAARGDIIGRIDGDSILANDWVERVTGYLGSHKDVVAVTGSPEPYDIGAVRIGKAIFHFYHYLVSRVLLGSDLMWGANCAFRTSAWHQVKNGLTLRNDIWEDYDLSFLLMRIGRIKYLKNLVVECSFRPVHKPFLVQYEYHMRQVNTYDIHRPELHYILILFIIGSKMLMIYPITLLDMYVIRPLANKNRTFASMEES